MHSHLRRAGATIALTSALALACGDADATSDSDAASGSTSVATTQASAGPSTGAGSSSDAGGPSTGGTNGATSSGTSAGPTGPTEVTDTDDAKFDVAAEDVPEDTGDQPSCTVSRGELDAVPPCDIETPPDSFEPIVQWEWWGDGAHTNSLTTPLVANLTDDNDDGQIDLCDTPDLLIYAHVGLTGDPERMFVLDGATGAVHWDYDGGFRFSQVPAIGDLD
ncbi:MAG: hypothetical protein KC468_36220, partial [Myxococcales bacterium]|nr:hypothetical protein [Myxococcales bacterium]